jgi:hypothetical protein
MINCGSDDRGWVLGVGRDHCLSYHFSIGSGTHPSSLQWPPGVLSKEIKVWSVKVTTQHLVRRSKKNSVVFSPQANYTDRETAAYR